MIKLTLVPRKHEHAGRVDYVRIELIIADELLAAVHIEDLCYGFDNIDIYNKLRNGETVTVNLVEVE